MVAEVVKALEDEVAKWLDKTDRLTHLILLKHLRLAYPHQSSALSEIERDISYEIRKRERRQ